MDRSLSIASSRDTTMTTHPALPVRRTGAALLLVALLAGCGQGAPKQAPAPAGSSRGAHAALTGDAVCGGATAHDVHVRMFRCDACHPTGATFGFDVPFTFAGGTTTLGGTLVRDATGTTCTVACHYPKGAPAVAITWSTPGPLACTTCHDASRMPQAHPPVAANATRADCQACHLLGDHTGGTVAVTGHSPAWSDETSAGFHAASANADLASCRGCHGQDLAGTAVATACARCHDVGLPAGVASWKVSCVMCHGGVDLPGVGAPPKATWGNSADAVRIGAHTTHLRASALAPAAGCDACHPVPTDVFTPGHLDGGTAEVTFSRAVPGVTSTWNRATATCSGTYCHGAGLGGGSKTAPVWTRVGLGEAACGTCHGLPPPPPHPVVGSSLTGCAGCHALTLDPAGAMIPPAQGGKHLDGAVEATGGHPAAFKDPASPGFHAYAANRGLSPCQGCHGAALDGAGGSTTVSCATCHGAGWASNCTMCHGGVGDTTGAPPRATWGGAGDPLRVGAHAKHVVGGSLSGAIACGVCHPVPADAFSAGHLGDAPAEVTFGGIATASGATPGWNRASGTCASTYCHGGYSGVFQYDFWGPGSVAYAGANATPSWTGASMTCASCHGDPPATGTWHTAHGGGTQCELCHPDASGPPGSAVIANPALHVNGVIDLAPRWVATCFRCH